MAEPWILEDFQEAAKAKDGECLSKHYYGWKEMALWICHVCEYVWFTKFSNIGRGKWCPRCAGVLPHSLLLAKYIAKMRGGECLSTEYHGNGKNLDWLCHKDNYRWKATLVNVKNKGTWCPKCGNRPEITLYEAKEWAIKKEGLCLSETYEGIHEKLKWCCKFGHIWYAEFAAVKHLDTWCPKCVHRQSAQELEIFEKVKEIYPDALDGVYGLLKNGRFHLDVYVPSKKKAIEFDGPRHDPEHQMYSEGTLEKDQRKDQECIEAGIELLRIKYKDYIKDKEDAMKKIFAFLDA